jgi:hypothetical protein
MINLRYCIIHTKYALWWQLSTVMQLRESFFKNRKHTKHIYQFCKISAFVRLWTMPNSNLRKLTFPDYVRLSPSSLQLQNSTTTIIFWLLVNDLWLFCRYFAIFAMFDVRLWGHWVLLLVFSHISTVHLFELQCKSEGYAMYLKVLYSKARKEGGQNWYESNRLKIAYHHRSFLILF